MQTLMGAKYLTPRRLLSHAKKRVKETARPWVKHYTSRRVDLDPSLWGLQVEQGALALHGHVLSELLHEWGSPLHVVDAARLRCNVEDFLAVPAGQNRGCEVFYSYKTNPIPGVLRYMHARGVGAEVISPYELWLAFELGMAPEQIIYNGPAKSDASIREAIERQILLLNINHHEEIQRVAHIARAVGKRARVGLRISGDAGWTGQFGIPLAEGKALAAYAEAMATEGLEVVGLHAHRGVLMHSLDEVRAHVQTALDFVETLREELGLHLTMLDLGGSLAVPTVRPFSAREKRFNQTFLADVLPPDVTTRPTIREYVATVMNQVNTHYQSKSLPVPRILLEPGRAMTGNTQMLLCSVITTKVDTHELTYAILDAGINIADYVRSEYHQIFSATKYGEAPAGCYRLAGPICQPGDVIYAAWQFPTLVPSDVLAIMDSGAYFVPSGNSFSFPQPGIVMIDDEMCDAQGRSGVRVLRRPESFADQIALDKLA